MTISDEKIDQLLTILTESMKSMQAVQTENNKLHSDLLRLMSKQFEIQETSMNASRDAKPEYNHDDPHHEKKKWSNKPKPVRPSVDANIDDIEWGIFLDKWNHYKTITELEGTKEICLELRESCSANVNKLLYQFVGPEELKKTSLTEQQMLDHIKSVAVKTIHEEVHRYNYHQMTQQDSESVAKYVGRLKSQAGLCNFNVKCSCGCATNVSYADEMISQKLVAGLANTEHQSRIISEAGTHKDLKSKVDRLITLETTDDATSKLAMTSPTSPTRLSALKSQYAKSKKPTNFTRPNNFTRLDGNQPNFLRGRSNNRESPQRRRRCRGCGRTSHGNGKSLTRDQCPAKDKTCDNCGLLHHLAKVCGRRQTRASFAMMADDTPSETDVSDYSEYEEESEVAEVESVMGQLG